MDGVKDFWPEPAYAQLLLDMQKRVHDYVVAEKGTAKEALDLWSRIGRRPSTKKARSDDARSPGPGACGVRPARPAPAIRMAPT